MPGQRPGLPAENVPRVVWMGCVDGLRRWVEALWIRTCSQTGLGSDRGVVLKLSLGAPVQSITKSAKSQTLCCQQQTDYAARLAKQTKARGPVGVQRGNEL